MHNASPKESEAILEKAQCNFQMVTHILYQSLSLTLISLRARPLSKRGLLAAQLYNYFSIVELDTKYRLPHRTHKDEYHGAVNTDNYIPKAKDH